MARGLADGLYDAVPGHRGRNGELRLQNLTFGNPWGQANFNGDISAFEISVGASDFPRR